MPSTLAAERGLVLGNGGQLAVAPENWRTPAVRDVSLVGTGRLKPADEIELVNDVLEQYRVVPISLGPIFGGGNVIWGATPVARLGINGPIIYQDDGGATTAEIFSALTKTDADGKPISGALAYLHAGILGLIASPVEIGNIPINPIYRFGEAVASGIFSMKMQALERKLGRAVGVTEVESASLSEVFPNGSRAVNLLLVLSLLAGAGLGVPASDVKKKITKSSGGPDNGGQGPEFSKILKWVLPVGGGITVGYLISACARALGLPEPAVKVSTNTPDAGPSPSPTPTERPSSTHTAILAATQTETPFFGGGGPVFTADIGLRLERLAAANQPLPVCDQSANQSADREQWESPQAADIEAAGGDVQNLYSLLRSGLPAGAQIRLCVNSEGWYFRVTTADGAPVWNQIKGDDGQWRWTDHPNQIPVDENGNIKQWRMMRLPGLFSDSVPLVIDGVPAEVQLDKDDKPTAYFDPLTGEWISLKPEPTPTSTRTASPTPTTTNTPRPTAIPATAIPKPSPTFTLEPSPTATLQPEGFISTRGVLPSREELIGCATGVNLSSLEGDQINPVIGQLHYYRNRVSMNNSGALTFEDGRLYDINVFPIARINQIDSNGNVVDAFENVFSISDFSQIIKAGDFLVLIWQADGTPRAVGLYCNSR